ncbi:MULTISPECIES: hypothetical protein [unclassified Janthinobacterium]|uniref:hypothetical protein n=1 Tax=unclassified Janthinobacterium TaxID=2610881 RepID=UPI001609A84B|nr:MULTISPECIES: hypothetical protein [unclassified Janthinobacterium]MBB5367486.1 hypothetical protein [Janthinobacterium sp. K2C7]MBB5380036.1 hypothetical protein [Janthinobacterium sp. K2Li3]MBB5385868.1 hypothetical protein [Janthinobacterium sp. K2E3]
MQFSYKTLSSTFSHFNSALKSRGLTLPLETSRNVWAQIVLGKNFSAAAAHTKAKGLVTAIPISDDSIRANLQVRSREIGLQVAQEIFSEAIEPDIAELSQAMQELIEVINLEPHLCVMSVLSDSSGLGLLDSKKPGYFPVSKFGTVDLTENEVSWLKSSSRLAANTINTLAGKNRKAFFNIFAENHRENNNKYDEVFGKHFAAAIEPTCITIVQALLEEFEPADISNWFLDFDQIRDIVFTVFERACGQNRDWLKPDGDLAEAVTDHVAVRLREALKWMAEQANIGEIDDSPLQTLMQSARLAMRKMLNNYD